MKNKKLDGVKLFDAGYRSLIGGVGGMSGGAVAGVAIGGPIGSLAGMAIGGFIGERISRARRKR